MMLHCLLYYARARGRATTRCVLPPRVAMARCVACRSSFCSMSFHASSYQITRLLNLKYINSY